ncbi:MAG: hypothetical protein ABSG51_00820 [Terracidiphilus sp.]
MRAATPKVKEIQEVYAGPALVYSAPKTVSTREEEEPLQREFGRDGDIFKGILVTLIMEAAAGLCIYLIWHFGHLLR